MTKRGPRARQIDTDESVRTHAPETSSTLYPRTELRETAAALKPEAGPLGLCAPCLSLGRRDPAVTVVGGTHMCTEHARESYGDVITRG